MFCLEVKGCFSSVLFEGSCVSAPLNPPGGEGASCQRGKDRRGRSSGEEGEGKVGGERSGMSEQKYCVWLSLSLGEEGRGRDEPLPGSGSPSEWGGGRKSSLTLTLRRQGTINTWQVSGRRDTLLCYLKCFLFLQHLKASTSRSIWVMTVFIIGPKLAWNYRHDWSVFHHQIQLLADRLFNWSLIGCNWLLGILCDKPEPLCWGSHWGPLAASPDWDRTELSWADWGASVLEMSGVEGVVCEGWLRKSPPEKKLRRYVSSHLVFLRSANINKQHTKTQLWSSKAIQALVCPSLLSLILNTPGIPLDDTVSLKSHSKCRQQEKKKK